eukprot:TRINITY_DN10208_c0_g1_i1.p1 TRINITY_DN10208_c0_g1~~TRINITY_DN10208_c0_g1_i1.p1  ORF type:complete len:625 (+),score=90.03 TRINITY_DN10208_c0_g1_i1:71-1945(+)
MGCSQGSGVKTMSGEEQEAAFDLSNLNEERRDSWLENFRPDVLAAYSVLVQGLHAERRSTWKPADATEDRCLGALLGLAIGDALGAPLEFSTLRYAAIECRTLGQEDIWEIHPEFAEKRPIKNEAGYNYFGLKPGQFTDDTSMALCLADSLLVCRGFQPLDLRLRFLNWWQFGYNSAFKFDTERRQFEWCSSVGLGGNIGESLSEFKKRQECKTKTGNSLTSGNGSIMRLSPCAIFFRNDPPMALEVAELQSYTTHQGDEAAECCRLLAHLLLGAFYAPSPSEVVAPKAKAKAKSHVAGAKAKSGPRGRSPARGASPSAARGASPSAARGASPSAARGASPSAARGASPSAARGASPSAARGASPSPAPGVSPAGASSAAHICAGTEAVDKRWLLEAYCSQFQSKLYSVNCLANSCAESVANQTNQGVLFQKGDFVVSAESLDVFKGPFRESSVVGQLQRGSEVKVSVVLNGFGKIDEPIGGFVERFDEQGNVFLETVGWRDDRNWNWRDPDFRFSVRRVQENPDYIGSYCMDCLSMALHCVWTTESFSEALLKVVNLGGDSDTVGAVAGQLAGAIYGASAVPSCWREQLERWDGGDIALKAWLLYHRDNEVLLSRCVRDVAKA